MIKNIAWNMFKNTGNIDTFLEFKQIQNIEQGNVMNTAGIIQNSNIPVEGNMLNNGTIPTIQKVELDGINKDKWNNNF